MDWVTAGVSRELAEWLSSSAADRYARERKLDPFATSMRDFDDVSPNLSRIRDGKGIGVADGAQRITDLRGTGLISENGGELSKFGDAVLAAWEHHDVANSVKGDEFARILSYLAEGQRLDHPLIMGYLSYWHDLRASFDPLVLIDSWDNLFAINCLDFERAGFAPGSAVRDGRMRAEDIELGLVAFADDQRLPTASKHAAEHLENAVGGKIPRGRHRASFAMGLECLSGDATAPNAVLGNFGYPKRPRDWTKFNDTQLARIHLILSGVDVLPKESGGETREENALYSILVRPERAALALPEAIDFEKGRREPPRLAGAAPGNARTNSGSKKIDYVARAETNDTVGKLGEEFAMRYERWRLRHHPDLASTIKHVSELDDSLGYDISSFELDGKPRYVEVKGTIGPISSPFFMTAKEVKCSSENRESYVVLRVGNLETDPQFCEIRPPFEGVLDFTPATFQVRFAGRGN